MQHYKNFILIVAITFNNLLFTVPPTTKQAHTNSPLSSSIQSSQQVSGASSSSSSDTPHGQLIINRQLLLEAIKKTPSENLSSKNSSEKITAAIFANLEAVLKKQNSLPTKTYRDVGTQTDPQAADRRFARTFSNFDGKTQEKLIRLIKNETKGIDISAYEFNLYKVAYALCQKQKDGIPIRLILNNGCHIKTALLLMKCCKIPMKFCGGVRGRIMHQKVMRFDANTEKLVFLDPNNQNDKLIINNLDELIPIVWDGSFNFTGDADRHNSESTTISSDETTYPIIKNEYESWWNSIPDNADKLAKLDATELKTNDLTSNSVPSRNVLYLLQSIFYMKESSKGRHLKSKELLAYQDFVPSEWRDNPEYADLPSIIQKPVVLPFPCTFKKSNEQEHPVFTILGRDDYWYTTEELQLLATQLSVKLNNEKRRPISQLGNLFFKYNKKRHNLSDLQSTDYLSKNGISEQENLVGPYKKLPNGWVLNGKYTYKPQELRARRETLSTLLKRIDKPDPE